MTPYALRRRMAHGNIYPSEKIDAALSNYFREGNLGALRELALVWMADRVDEALQDYMKVQGIEGPWETRERILVGRVRTPGRRGADPSCRTDGDAQRWRPGRCARDPRGWPVRNVGAGCDANADQDARRLVPRSDRSGHPGCAPGLRTRGEHHADRGRGLHAVPLAPPHAWIGDQPDHPFVRTDRRARHLARLGACGRWTPVGTAHGVAALASPRRVRGGPRGAPAPDGRDRDVPRTDSISPSVLLLYLCRWWWASRHSVGSGRPWSPPSPPRSSRTTSSRRRSTPGPSPRRRTCSRSPSSCSWPRWSACWWTERRALRSEAQRGRAEAEALARLAGWLLREEDPLPDLVEYLRSTFGLTSVSVLRRSEDGWVRGGLSGTVTTHRPRRGFRGRRTGRPTRSS